VPPGGGLDRGEQRRDRLHPDQLRDVLVALHGVCAQPQEAGIDIRPILCEVAELSSRDDKYGMGSMRDILLRAAR
jgi:hypothetical protein